MRTIKHIAVGYSRSRGGEEVVKKNTPKNSGRSLRDLELALFSVKIFHSCPKTNLFT